MDEGGTDITNGGGVPAAQAIANAALAEALNASTTKKDADGRRSEASSELPAEDNKDEGRSKKRRSDAKDNATGVEGVTTVQQGQQRRKGGKQGGPTMKKRLHEVWKFTLEAEENEDQLDPKEADKLFHKAYNATLDIVGDQLDSIIQEGLQAYKHADQLAQELALAKETSESKDQELRRLRETDANHRKTIQNLLRAVDKTKTDALAASKTALVEGELRVEMQAIMTQKDKAQEAVKESKRKYSLLEDELRQTKIKLAKVEQEKIVLERDRNATMSWAKSVDNSMSSDCDFYKRKVTEQNTHIQGLNAVIAEKNSQIQEMRRQIERSMSNNRLAQFRASTSSQAEHNYPPSNNKKARKRASY